MAEKRKFDGKPRGERQNKKSYFNKKIEQEEASLGLPVGSKGFYVTSILGKEKNSVNEVIRLLGEYVNESEVEKTEEDSESGKNEETEKQDLEDEIAQELAEFKNSRKESIFKPVFTGVSCISFIKCPGSVDVIEITRKMMDDIASNKSKSTRYTCRLVPIQMTCGASTESIINGVQTIGNFLLDPESSPVSFMAAVKIRNNSKVDKTEVVNAIGKLFGEKNNVNLTYPDYTIMVEVFRSICILSIIKDYVKFRKYNIVGLFSEGVLQEKKT